MFRFQMWEDAFGIIKDNIIFGVGLGNSNLANQFLEDKNYNIQLHPHNGAVQIWLETGIIGVVFSLIFLYYVYQALKKVKDNFLLTLYVSIFSAYLVYFNFSFSFYAKWWLASLFLSLIFAKESGKIHLNDRGKT